MLAAGAERAPRHCPVGNVAGEAGTGREGSALNRRCGCQGHRGTSASGHPFDAECPPRVDMEESSHGEQRKLRWGQSVWSRRLRGWTMEPETSVVNWAELFRG